MRHLRISNARKPSFHHSALTRFVALQHDTTIRVHSYRDLVWFSAKMPGSLPILMTSSPISLSKAERVLLISTALSLQSKRMAQVPSTVKRDCFFTVAFVECLRCKNSLGMDHYLFLDV